MDITVILILFGFVLCGVCIGLPIGHFYGKRQSEDFFVNSYEIIESHPFSTPEIVSNAQKRQESKDVLNAEVIE